MYVLIHFITPFNHSDNEKRCIVKFVRFIFRGVCLPFLQTSYYYADSTTTFFTYLKTFPLSTHISLRNPHADITQFLPHTTLFHIDDSTEIVGSIRFHVLGWALASRLPPTISPNTPLVYASFVFAEEFELTHTLPPRRFQHPLRPRPRPSRLLQPM